MATPQIVWHYDAYGHDVPERLVSVFCGRREMTEIAEGLETLRGRIAALISEPCGLDLDYNEIKGYIEAARTRVMQAMPMEPCNCTSRNNQCQLCRGYGWVSAKSLLGRRP